MKECVGIFIELVWKKYRNFLFSYLLFYLFYSSLHGNLKKWKNSFGFKYPISSIVINILQLFESLRYSWSRKFANSEMLRVVNFSLRLFYINEYKVWIFGKKRRKIRMNAWTFGLFISERVESRVIFPGIYVFPANQWAWNLFKRG